MPRKIKKDRMGPVFFDSKTREAQYGLHISITDLIGYYGKYFSK
jgi:hypothetical protein